MTCKHALLQLLDLVDVLNWEISDEELGITFFDRAIIEGLQQGLITDDEADLMANYLNEVAP